MIARMAQPIVFDVPHQLGVAEAKRRLSGSFGDLERSIPGASAIRSRWEGDRMIIDVEALGQKATANLDVHDSYVRMEVVASGLLGIIGQKISSLLRGRAAAALEDKTKPAAPRS
jgi:hypothetical protein